MKARIYLVKVKFDVVMVVYIQVMFSWLQCVPSDGCGVYLRHNRTQPTDTATPCVIASFRRQVDEICAPLGYYVAYSGNSLPTFLDNLPVPSSRVILFPSSSP